jgi:hypothetical protein
MRATLNKAFTPCAGAGLETRLQAWTPAPPASSESTQEGRVHIGRKTRLAPAQSRDVADDTELPLPTVEKGLKIACRLQCRCHRRGAAARILANHACCSTRPEAAGGGGMSMGSSPVLKSCRIASCVSAVSISRRRTASSSGPACRQVSTHRRKSSSCEFAGASGIYNSS